MARPSSKTTVLDYIRGLGTITPIIDGRIDDLAS
jgi:hypothetical protein